MAILKLYVLRGEIERRFDLSEWKQKKSKFEPTTLRIANTYISQK